MALRLVGARTLCNLAPLLQANGWQIGPRIEQFADAMFLEDVRRDERQLVNGLSEFPGPRFVLRWIEADSVYGSRNLAHDRTDSF
jgi:hypothetical protein